MRRAARASEGEGERKGKLGGQPIPYGFDLYIGFEVRA